MIRVTATDRFNQTIRFDIDFETGELTPFGRPKDHKWIRSIIELTAAEVKKTGRIRFAWQQSYPAKNPFHDPHSMALALMSSGYTKIEGDLSKFPLPEADETKPGAIN